MSRPCSKVLAFLLHGRTDMDGSIVLPDETINYWADEFARAGLLPQVTFIDFLQLPYWKRARMVMAKTELNLLRATVFPFYQKH